LEQETKQKDRLDISLLQVNFDSSAGKIVMLDFSLEGGDIKQAAIQVRKRQDSLNLQQQTLWLWSPNEGDCKDSLLPCQAGSTKHIQYGQTGSIC